MAVDPGSSGAARPRGCCFIPRHHAFDGRPRRRCAHRGRPTELSDRPHAGTALGIVEALLIFSGKPCVAPTYGVPSGGWPCRCSTETSSWPHCRPSSRPPAPAPGASSSWRGRRGSARRAFSPPQPSWRAPEGATVLRARAGPLEQPFAFGVARQLYVPLRTSEEWEGLATGAAALASRALDDGAPEPAGAEDAVHAAAHGLVWLTVNLAERSPCALVVDDLQWADAPSLRWLAQLARRVDELPLALVGAVRTGEPTERPELLAEVLAAAESMPVRPRPLGLAATGVLVRQRLPRASDAFTEACHGVCGGNPFLLRALVSQVEAEGMEPDDAAAARLTTFGPEQVARSVELQLERLADGAADLAHALAVLERRGPLRHAAELAGLELPQATRLADALHGCGLVGADGQPQLAHPVMSAALYAALPSGERSIWHGRAARLLARERVDPERVALHLLRTEPAGDEEAVALLRAAAASASGRGAPETAATYLRRALDEPPADRATEARVRLELGLALTARLERGGTDYLREAVELSDDPVLRGEAALRGSRSAALASMIEEAVEIAEAALADTEGMPTETIARLEAEAMVGRTVPAMASQALRRLRGAARATVDAGALAYRRRGGGDVRRRAGCRRARSDRTGACDPCARGGAGLGLEHDWRCWARDERCARDGRLSLRRGDRRGAAARVGDDDCARELHPGTRALPPGRAPRGEADASFAYDFKVATLSVPFAIMWTISPLLDVLVEAERLDDADALSRPPRFRRRFPTSSGCRVSHQPRRASARAGSKRGGDGRPARVGSGVRGARAPEPSWQPGAYRRSPSWPARETDEAERLAAEQLALAERMATRARSPRASARRLSSRHGASGSHCSSGPSRCRRKARRSSSTGGRSSSSGGAAPGGSPR